MKYITLMLAIALLNVRACSQNITEQNIANLKRVGGPCEGCDAIYESPVPFEKLNNMCWLPDWKEAGTTLAVNGTVYKPDGTPAAGVIIYIYHTDQTGQYPTKGTASGWGKRHGYIRGWMKTNEKGEYKFFTLKPQPYPGRKDPVHIHVTIKESDKNAYWIDDYVFDDDTLLTKAIRIKLEDRGGSGILPISSFYKGRKSLKSERNIYLGRNIPGYPAQKAKPAL
jgi:protocatechuate 3,4-dioxygenase beta subunit